MTLDATDFARRLAQATAADATPQRSLPCAPWDRWLLVALHRHRSRQQFVEQVVRERLSASPERIAELGIAGHPQDSDSGQVPGMSEWSYVFEGRGCSLTHDDGTAIDVDFDREHGSAIIDPYFYKTFLESKPELGWPELLLRTPDGDWEAWMASIQPLLAAGLLDGDHGVRVLPHVQAWCEAVSQALEQAERVDSQLRAIALALEDYPLAATLDPRPAVREAAEQQLEQRCSELEARIAGRVGPHVTACLSALRALDPERARSVALAQLHGSAIDGVLTASMRMLDEDPRPADVPAVCQLLDRLRTHVEVPAPFLRVCAARHLLHPHRRATVPEQLRTFVLDVLADNQRTSEGEAALLVYLLDRDRGLARIRAGRTSGAFMVREVCGAVFDWVRGGSPNARALGLAEWLWREHEAWLRQWDDV
ncbi:MAG TPA: hypothetical protein VM869_03425 [Enhygromyxa sp.]|nr:hypothetical protein [Enhygromyxa sp.]